MSDHRLSENVERRRSGDRTGERRGGSPENRRRGPDTLSKSIRIVAIIGWLFLLSAMVFIDLAKPKYVTVFEQRNGAVADKNIGWDMEMARAIFLLQVGGFVFGTYGFVMNMKRSRRKSDRYRINLLVLAIISLFGMVYYLLFF